MPTHSNVHDACPACDGQRCRIYATEDQANAAADQVAYQEWLDAEESRAR